jgi:hypothetical protein
MYVVMWAFLLPGWRQRTNEPGERVKGIEPSSPAWKAGALPLSYTRVAPTITPVSSAVLGVPHDIEG